MRELHVYGSVVPVAARDPSKFQHQGLIFHDFLKQPCSATIGFRMTFYALFEILFSIIKSNFWKPTLKNGPYL